MTQKVFELTGADPAQLYGPSNVYLKQIGAYFPALKIVARGHEMKVSGPQESIDEFEDKLEAIVAYVRKNKRLDERALEELIQARDTARTRHTMLKDEVILHGPQGRIIKAKTTNQHKLV